MIRVSRFYFRARQGQFIILEEKETENEARTTRDEAVRRECVRFVMETMPPKF